MGLGVGRVRARVRVMCHLGARLESDRHLVFRPPGVESGLGVGVRVRRDSGRRALFRPGEGEALALCVGIAVLLGLVHLHESGQVR